MGVVESATQLFQQLSASGDGFTRYLRPGLPDARIEELLDQAGLPPLPPEVRAFYCAFDLVPHYQYGPDQPTFYGIYWLMSFQDALQSWVERRSYDFLEPRWRESFPLMQEGGPLMQKDGSVYLIDTEVNANGDHQVVHDFYCLDPTPEFTSVASMFDTFTAWMACGALPAASGTVPGHYEGDDEMIRTIAARLNPGILRWNEGCS